MIDPDPVEHLLPPPPIAPNPSEEVLRGGEVEFEKAASIDPYLSPAPFANPIFGGLAGELNAVLLELDLLLIPIEEEKLDLFEVEVTEIQLSSLSLLTAPPPTSSSS